MTRRIASATLVLLTLGHGAVERSAEAHAPGRLVGDIASVFFVAELGIGWRGPVGPARYTTISASSHCSRSRIAASRAGSLNSSW